jgi:Asp-tRNA(Asn)/Glu-tRNA(Gln) amidotransferase C subunit
MERCTLNAEDIATLAGVARLNLSDDRNRLQAEVLNGIFQMLDTLDEVQLGETSPAFSFHAKWEDRDE